MESRKQTIMAVLPMVCLGILIVCSNTAIEGAKRGLALWANVIVPTLLPFIILTNIIIHGKTLSLAANHPVIKKYQPCIILSIFVGFLCGYPMGGKFVNDLYTGGFIDNRLANILLVLCNNASPMFILGYVIRYGLESLVSPFFVFSLLYIPNIIIFLLRYIRYKKQALHAATFQLMLKPATMAELITQSIQSILLIGAYIMIFSIITELLMGYATNLLLLPISSLEITVGIALLKNAALMDTKKTALILALTAFGGFSSIAQTKSVANNSALSFLSYTIWKLLLSVITGSLAFFIIS